VRACRTGCGPGENFVLKWRLAAAFAAALAAPAFAQAPAPPAAAAAEEEQVRDIVVLGRRTGIPFWEVRGEGRTMFLVGSINGVSSEGRWDPAALTAVLRRADRVMFPEAREFTIGNPFRLIGYFARWRRQASLPRGRSLAQMLPPGELGRLAALRNRRMVDGDYLTTHPFHLAGALRQAARRGTGEGQDVREFVRRAIRRERLVQVPIARGNTRELARDLFTSPPEEHVPCLVSAITLAEAGPEAIRARSKAWVERRVADVLASPAEAVEAACWPSDHLADLQDAADIRTTIRGVIGDPQVTVSVLQLRTLASPGGVLDDLESAGYEIVGPDWR
jgi:uncharacterized protein YbaP (TraB family)